MNVTEDRSAAHREAWDLMAWVVGGSATLAQRELVERHLRDCAACREEHAFQCQVRDGLVHGWPAPPEPGPCFERLWQRLTDEGDTAPAAARDLQVAGRPARSALWSQGWAAAVVVQAVGLAALGGAYWTRGERLQDYSTLSAAPAAAPPATIRLVPTPAMSLAELRSLLARHSLRIVESSADGSYFGLALTAEAAGRSGLDSARDAAARVAQLRGERGVLMAEPIGAALR